MRLNGQAVTLENYLDGKAKVTFSFDSWKEGQVAPTTIEIPVVEPQKKQAAEP